MRRMGFRVMGLALAVLATGAAALLGQQQTAPLVPLTDEQKVDVQLSEMLAAWQLGEVELMHKYFAEDVLVVSGLYEPPVMGWANYAVAYQQQRKRMEQVRLERRNTFTYFRGNIAWASYQWELSAIVDGRPSAGQGHTTIILEKRGGRWLIVHDHTSTVGPMRTMEAAPQPPPKPGA